MFVLVIYYCAFLCYRRFVFILCIFLVCVGKPLIRLLLCVQDPNDTPPPTRVETREERLERRRRERAEQVAYKLEQEIAVCKFTYFEEYCLRAKPD